MSETKNVVLKAETVMFTELWWDGALVDESGETVYEAADYHKSFNDLGLELFDVAKKKGWKVVEVERC